MPAFLMEPYRYDYPEAKYTPQEQAESNQPRPSPRVCYDHVVPGSLSAEIRAHNHEWAEDEKTGKVSHEIATLMAILAVSEPL